jgi:thioredoxin-related protein
MSSESGESATGQMELRNLMRSLFAGALIFAVSLSAFAAEKHQPPSSIAGLKPATVDGLTWTGDLAAALEQAAKENKLVFIDFTGVSCTNCRINEKSVFVKPEVKDLFSQYVRVQIYTDEIPKVSYKEAPDDAKREADAEVNQKFQKAVFKTEQLPLYVVVKPAEAGKFEIVGEYDEGRINKVDKFLEFLKKPLNKN